MLYNSYIKQNECLVFIEMKGMIQMSIEQEKLNALNQALGKLEKEFGKG